MPRTTSFGRACDASLRRTPPPLLSYSYPVSSPWDYYNKLQTHTTFFVVTRVIFSFFIADVNFASELSDLRHRHGFQVVLVHGNHASPALLQHANRHVAFQDITADLPPRMLVKAQVGLTK